MRAFAIAPFEKAPLIRKDDREEKSLCHVSMVVEFLDDNKPKKSLKRLFALFQTSPILSNFI